VNEAYLKKRLCDTIKAALPGVVIFRHEDKFTGGIPDCSFTHNDRTCWVEVKYRRPGSPGKLTKLQRLVLGRLVRHGRALVITYVERTNGSLTILVDRPPLLQDEEVDSNYVECGRTFNHAGAVDYIIEELQR
jgi:hypothetical protein